MGVVGLGVVVLGFWMGNVVMSTGGCGNIGCYEIGKGGCSLGFGL